MAREQERNQLVAATIATFLKPKQNGMHLADIAARLLALGLYHDPSPPDALQHILQHNPRFRLDRDYWKIATRADRQYPALGLEHDDTFDFFGEERKRPKRKHPPQKEFAHQVYRFLSSFRHAKGLWRRVEICGDRRLREFDRIMRDAFGHDSLDHLSEFYFSTDAWLIGELGLEPSDALSYTYDFGNWRNAMTVFHTIVDEVLEQFYQFHDEGGALRMLIERGVKGLAECYSENAGIPTIRAETLRAIFDVYQFDVEFGGIGLGDNVSEIILEYATPQEKNQVTQWMREAMKKRDNDKDVTGWHLEHCGAFLLKLNADELDDVQYIKICRDTGVRAGLGRTFACTRTH